MAPFIFLLGAPLAYVFFSFGPGVQRTSTVLGVFRRANTSAIQEEVVVIPDTINCEDIHYHAPSGMLFTACEDNVETRFRWFPPLDNFDDPGLARKARGSIHVVDPKTMKSQRLSFENFDTAFITHGLDVIPDPDWSESGDAVYIFAVNHIPDAELPQARSQIEVFHHVIGSSSAKHIRSVWHPLIRTPNDIVADSPTSIYVSNDHYYRSGLMRAIEDLYFNAKWTDTIHLEFDLKTASDSAAGVKASVALDRMHNNNGLGHGRTPNEILVVSCIDGVTHIGDIGPAGNITLRESISVDSNVDNPFYFQDPYAQSSGADRSGFILPGLTRAIDLARTTRDPEGISAVMVWFSQPKAGGKAGAPTQWESRLLFEDDGSRIRSASAAVLVAIGPESEDGQAADGVRKAWLFVTGFQSKNIIAVKVDL